MEKARAVVINSTCRTELVIKLKKLKIRVSVANMRSKSAVLKSMEYFDFDIFLIKLSIASY